MSSLLRRLLIVLCFVGLCARPLQGQTAAEGQPTGEVVLDGGNYTAGDDIGANLTLNAPASCDSYVAVQFTGNNHGVQLESPIKTGEQSVKLKGKLPRDLPGGEYTRYRGWLNPCEGDADQKPISLQGVAQTFLVTAYATPNKYPTGGEVALTVNQRQFFDTKILELNGLSVQLTNHLENGAADTPQLHEFLITVLRSARVALDVTEQQYRTQIMKSQGTAPALFADFRKQYDDLVLDLSNPAPGTVAEYGQRPFLVFVQAQLKKRDPQTRRTNNLSGTLPPSAAKADSTLSDNAAAYKYVKTTGRLTFDATLKSLPTGASVQYREVLDPEFTDYSSLTNISGAKFELATYIFKFSKAGCADRKLRINPYQDPHPEIEVEFDDCIRK